MKYSDFIMSVAGTVPVFHSIAAILITKGEPVYINGNQ